MVDTALHNDIEYLILRDLLHFGNVTLPEICVLAIAEHSAQITPDGQTILPPRKALEVYHPENATENNIITSIANHYEDCSFAQGATLYWNYIDRAIADGNTLTINSVAIVDMSSLGLITTSESLAHQLEPFAAPLPLPVVVGEDTTHAESTSQSEKTSTQREPYRGVASSPSAVDHGASGVMIFFATALVVVAAAFLIYYFAIL